MMMLSGEWLAPYQAQVDPLAADFEVRWSWKVSRSAPGRVVVAQQQSPGLLGPMRLTSLSKSDDAPRDRAYGGLRSHA